MPRRLADRLEAALEGVDLDLVGLVAVLREALGVVGDEREAVDATTQAQVAGRGDQLDLDGAELARAGGVGAPVVVEGALAQPLLAQAVEVDVGDRVDRAVDEAVTFGQQVAHLVDHGLAVPREVGRGLPAAGGGVHVGGRAALAGAAGQQPAVLGPGDGDRAAREVGQHGGAGERRLGAGRHGHPHVLADLDVQDQAGDVGDVEEQVGSQGHSLPGDGDRLAAAVVARGEVATLVELAVGREVGLRGDAEDATAVDHERAVEDAAPVDQRSADEQDRQQVAALLDQHADRVADGVEEGVLEEQVLDGVAGQAQLGEDRDRDALVVAGAGLLQHGPHVGRRVGDGHGGGARRDTGEPLVVGVVEVHGPTVSDGGSPLG